MASTSMNFTSAPRTGAGSGGSFGGYFQGQTTVYDPPRVPGVNTLGGRELDAEAFDFQKQQFRQQDARRQQLLDLLGLNTRTVGPGGLLGGTFMQSILGNTAPNVVGGVTGAVPGLGHPGGPDGGASASGTLPGNLPGYGNQIMGLLGQFGAGERARIDQAEQDLLNTQLARLESRGLGGSNLATNAQTGAARFGAQQRLDLADKLIGQQVGALQKAGDQGITQRGQALDFLGGLLGDVFGII